MSSYFVDMITVWSSLLMVFMELVIVLILFYESGLDSMAYRYIRKKRGQLYKLFTPRGRRRFKRALSKRRRK